VKLVEFLHHGNTQIRQVGKAAFTGCAYFHDSIANGIHFSAVEHLVGYSATHTALFRRNQLVPVKDLKLLVKDYAV
jgi:hypothetical protein